MVPMMILKRPMRLRLATLLLAGVAIAAPVSLRLDAEAGLRLMPALAHAKDGDRGGDDRGGDDRGGDDRGGDDRGGDDRGGDYRGGDDRGGDDRGSDDRGGDDRGGHGRGSDDRGGDDRGRGGRDAEDRGGHGRGRDDRGTDDHGGRGRGRDDRPSGTAGGGSAGGGVVGGGQAGSRPTEIERSARGIEVTYADGWREELENGRYELKDAQGRTVVERTATGQDVARLSSFSR